MKVTLTATTATQIVLWRHGEMFAAQRADHAGETQICLGVDLFEVIAELAGLDLDDRVQAQEAVSLAAEGQRRLSEPQPDSSASERGQDWRTEGLEPG